MRPNRLTVRSLTVTVPHTVSALPAPPQMLSDRDQRQNTALHLAVDSGSLATVELLVDTSVADVNALNDTGDSPLHGAVVGGQLDIVKLLVRVGLGVI